MCSTDDKDIFVIWDPNSQNTPMNVRKGNFRSTTTSRIKGIPAQYRSLRDHVLQSSIQENYDKPHYIKHRCSKQMGHNGKDKYAPTLLPRQIMYFVCVTVDVLSFVSHPCRSNVRLNPKSNRKGDRTTDLAKTADIHMLIWYYDHLARRKSSIITGNWFKHEIHQSEQLYPTTHGKYDRINGIWTLCMSLGFHFNAIKHLDL